MSQDVLPRTTRAEAVAGSRRIYPVRTSAAPPVDQPARGQKRYRADLGPGGFRSKSRFWVDHNPRSRENVMRAALEKLLGHPFPKVRPPIMLNVATRRRLELDAFNEAMRLAVEFHGEQVREAATSH